MKQQREYERRWREKHRHPCVDCGQPCNRESTRCSKCSRLRINKSRYGPKSPQWKGGIRHDAGYIYIYKPDHPRQIGKYVAEHILIWEEANGKSLPKGWIIHHLNGIKDDNRPRNLEGLPNKKHYLVLQAKAKRIQELEALLNNQHQLL